MINSQNLEIYIIPPKQTISLYLENLYDVLEVDISESEGEKYFIYLFEIQSDKKYTIVHKNKIEISSPSYFDSLIKSNKLSYDIIPKGNWNLILKISDKSFINYQFVKCSNNNINFELSRINENNITEKKRQLIQIYIYQSQLIKLKL